MKELLYKELRLDLHATNVLFLALAAMVFIPGYPYAVMCFFTVVGIHALCLNARERGDALFTATLPVRKRDVVRARMGLAALLEVGQLVLAVPCFLVKDVLYPPELVNPVGMEANLALIGVCLALLGVYNLVFFPPYFRNVERVGVPFLAGSAVFWALMLLAEGLTHFVPLFLRLDTRGAAYMPEKLGALAVGAALFAAATGLAYCLSARAFERSDL